MPVVRLEHPFVFHSVIVEDFADGCLRFHQAIGAADPKVKQMELAVDCGIDPGNKREEDIGVDVIADLMAKIASSLHISSLRLP